METVWILVRWDTERHYVNHYGDEDEAIEMLKNARPYFTAYLYQCNPDGMISRVEGW